jgi:hypothetical protein
MADNLDQRKPLDAQLINLNQPYEVRFWLVELGLRESDLPQLERVIKRVGNNANDVKRWLRKYQLFKRQLDEIIARRLRRKRLGYSR